MSNRIFISYRRQDAIKDARSLYERLSREFGPDKVFIDLDGIAPGEDFVELLERQLDDCSALVVLIGGDWAGERLFDENDFVRIEVGAGLRRKIKVFPVLINGAAPPKSAELPEELRPLLRRQAISLDDRKFDADVARLALAIRRAIEPAPQGPAAPSEPHRPAESAPRPPDAPQATAQQAAKPTPTPTPREILASVAQASHHGAAAAPHRTPSNASAATTPPAGNRTVLWIAIAGAVTVGIVVAIMVFSGKSGSSGAYGGSRSNAVEESRPIDRSEPVPQASSGADKPTDGAGKTSDNGKPVKAIPHHAGNAADGDAPGTRTQEAASPFVGRWVNSVPGDGMEITISQSGSAITMTGDGFSSLYALGKDGRAIKRQLLAQDAQNGHEVTNVSDADVIETNVAMVTGDALTIDTTSNYRRQYFDHPVHVETSQRQFRRK